MSEVVITSALRTPIGSYLGQFSHLSAPQLASFVIQKMVADNNMITDHINECLIGCVLTADVGQAPSRQALLEAGLPNTIPCTTVNKVCGSGMKTLTMAFDAILSGSASMALAGGMESMSNAPYLVPGKNARTGMRMGHQPLIDHLFRDGLEHYSDGKLMGCFAENTAGDHSISRETQDAYARDSVLRARDATDTHKFDLEIVPIEGITRDEQVYKANIEKIPTLKPVFSKTGTVTAANSSSISDGAAMCLLTENSVARSLGLESLGRVVGYCTFAKAPQEFTTAVPGAITQLLQKINWKISDVDLFEINEAFSVVVLTAMETLGIDHERVNIRGGACAMGHPIGASGCRIVVTLVHAMRDTGCHKGIASVCLGGGEAMAIAIEM